MTVEANSLEMTNGKDTGEFHSADTSPDPHIALELTCAVLAIRDNEPVVLVVQNEKGADALPSGRFLPALHSDLETGLRARVREATELDLGYVEQLGTFSNRRTRSRGREAAGGTVSIGYLALMLGGDQLEPPTPGCAWRSVYEFFPWEDWRQNRPQILSQDLEPRLKAWADEAREESSCASILDLRERLTIAFGIDGARWDDERVLERYELLSDAGMLDGADGRIGRVMRAEHCRILAAGIGRLRAKIRYRPVVFELMQPEFTLFDLQRTVEAILGPHLHKQNFRRLVESVGLVEPTGEIRTHTGGRPARLYRFRREVLLERPAPGVRVKAIARG